MSTRRQGRRTRHVPTRRDQRVTRSRARRIEQRLDRVRQERMARAGRSLQARELGRPRLKTTVRIALIFCASLLAGAVLSASPVERAVRWWRDDPSIPRSIAVIGNERLSSEEVARATGLSAPENVRPLRLASVERRVSAHPWIRSTRAALLPTGTLIVEIEERVPRAVLRDTTNDREWLLDADGVLFAEFRESVGAEATLPRLVSPTPRRTGSADPELADALPLLEAIQRLGLPASHQPLALELPTAASPRGWVLHAPDGLEVILGVGDRREIGERLNRFGRLARADLAPLAQARSVDLRFAGQAVLGGLRASR